MEQTKTSPSLVAIPAWTGHAYGFVAAGLVPWIGVVAVIFDLEWAAFDLGLLVIFALTALLAFRRSSWLTLSALLSGILMVTDATIDITTSPVGVERAFAFIMALCIEIPLALLSFWVAWRLANSVWRALEQKLAY